MGRETKFGLLVGLVFIVLFGVILSGHANLSATDHAVMPTGESQAHATRAQTLHGTVDPFVQDAPLDVSGNPAPVGPAEEPLPAPSGSGGRYAAGVGDGYHGDPGLRPRHR